MSMSKHEPLPPDLQRGVSRFQAWRGTRKAGCRIPQPLWTIAIGLAKTHGVSRTAAVLRLDYYSLQKRVQAAVTPPQSSAPAFLELTSPALVVRQCRVELDNGSGNTMRVELVGFDPADLEVLSRSFWNVR